MEEDLKKIKKLLVEFMAKYNTEVFVTYDNERNVIVSSKIKV